MDSSIGKLFIGGISWDTDEVHLWEYFKNFGQIVEAVIMKDRLTGRARGFGFVVFVDPAVAEKVIMSKHLINGRMVEAKKVVPRDYHRMPKKYCKNIHGSPCSYQSKKIFVGGLASTVTDSDFRNYFQQFGTINDAVVMHDHSTLRPRGFGFITFDFEDAVEKVFHKAFHELNGKIVEVKIAIPRELSPGPNIRLPVGGSNIGLNRMNSLFNGHNQGYSPNSMGNYSVRMNGGFGPSAGGSSNGNNCVGYEIVLSPRYSINSRNFGYPIGYGGGNICPSSPFSSETRNLLGNAGLNYSNASLKSFMMPGSGSLNGIGNGGFSLDGSFSPFSANGVSSRGFSGTSSYGSYGRSNADVPINASLEFSGNDYDRNYTDSTWLSAFSEFDGSNPLGYGLGASVSGIKSKDGSSGYMDGYTISNKHLNRGVPA